MHNDLSIPTNNAIATLARRLLVAASLVFAIGLAGVVFARGEQQGPRIIWIGRGVVAPAPMRIENQPARSEHSPADRSHKPDLSTDVQAIRPETVQLLRDVSGDEAVPAAAIINPLPDHARPGRLMLMEVTAYCPCTKCCGPQAQGITASGKHVSYNNGKFVAADTRLLPFGTKLIIPGYGGGQPVEVIDRGGAIKGNKLDVYFDSHQEALVWGRQKLMVIVQD